jgi:hypothetical protein
MKRMTYRLQVFAIAATFILAPAIQAWDQGEASGGKIPSETPGKSSKKEGSKPVAKPPARTSSKGSATDGTKSTARPPVGAPDRIDGKWWTTGNGFGDSEVIFTQNGSSVSGVINYADGRTGTVAGTLVGKRLQHSWTNSSGDGGTGWLELSWNNFLGGPWHNQRVKDGSWTLSRIEGKWCFGGSRNRVRTVTHNARGQLSVVTEDGTHDEGYLQGPWLFLQSELGDIKGTMYFKGNRVDWSTGFYWTWCGR